MILQDLIVLLTGFFAGTLGALLGIGGGVIVVPFLVIFLHIPIRIAIGTSFLAVLSVSLSAASSYLKTGLCNIRIGISLELATVSGAITGALIAGLVNPKFLEGAFSLLLFYVAGRMLISRKKEKDDEKALIPPEKRKVAAQGASFAAGIVSGSLGVGGGIIKVPMLLYILRFPMKEAVATSSFMIGITVAASTVIFTLRGDVDPYVAALLIAGIFVGAKLGARVMPKVSDVVLKKSFALLLLYFGVRFIMMVVR